MIFHPFRGHREFPTRPSECLGRCERLPEDGVDQQTFIRTSADQSQTNTSDKCLTSLQKNIRDLDFGGAEKSIIYLTRGGVFSKPYRPRAAANGKRWKATLRDFFLCLCLKHYHEKKWAYKGTMSVVKGKMASKKDEFCELLEMYHGTVVGGPWDWRLRPVVCRQDISRK